MTSLRSGGKLTLMKKLLAILVLGLMFCSSSYAEWEKIYSDKNSEHFIDKSKFKKEGKSIYYWHLVNYLIQNENIYWKSSLTYTEVDCNLFRGKDHVFNFYSEFMGEGEILGDHNPPNEWVSPEPNTLRYLSYNEVCDQ